MQRSTALLPMVAELGTWATGLEGGTAGWGQRERRARFHPEQGTQPLSLPLLAPSRRFTGKHGAEESPGAGGTWQSQPPVPPERSVP